MNEQSGFMQWAQRWSFKLFLQTETMWRTTALLSGVSLLWLATGVIMCVCRRDSVYLHTEYHLTSQSKEKPTWPLNTGVITSVNTLPWNQCVDLHHGDRDRSVIKWFVNLYNMFKPELSSVSCTYWHIKCLIDLKPDSCLWASALIGWLSEPIKRAAFL